MNLVASGSIRVRSHAITNLFLTGPPGTGKTTILFSALKACLPDPLFAPNRPAGREARTRPAPTPSAGPDRRGAGGFVVKKVYRAGRRAAMDLVDLGTGCRATLVSFPAPGWPEVKSGAFVEVGVPAIRGALARAAIVVMDELGRFELAEPAFLVAVREALDSPVPVVGVLKAESNPFLDAIRARSDTAVISLDPATRDPGGRDPALRKGAEARFTAALAGLLRTGGGSRRRRASPTPPR